MSETSEQLLNGRHAVVTGAAGAIGAAICERFRAFGARVSALDIARRDSIVHCDVTDEAGVRSAFQHCATLQRVTDVVHAAGLIAVASVEAQSVGEFRRIVEVNLTGSFIVGREAARHLSRGGSLTFLSSQAGLKGGAYWSAYAASKGGVNRLVDCLAEELGPHGIRVNAVCPGTVETPMLHEAVNRLAGSLATSREALLTRYRDRVPLGRFASPHEIGDLCVMLASPLTGYVNGVMLVADGGELTR